MGIQKTKGIGDFPEDGREAAVDDLATHMQHLASLLLLYPLATPASESFRGSHNFISVFPPCGSLALSCFLPFFLHWCREFGAGSTMGRSAL